MNEAINSGVPAAIRYPSGREQSDVIRRFYKNNDFEKIGIKCDFDPSTELDAIIVTHGRITSEAIKAADKLSAMGVKAGIILLEKLKPYTESAELIAKAIPSSARALLFLEEEIRSGGAGMNLSDKLSDFLAKRGIKSDVLAIDDSFVSFVKEGQSIYEAAGVDCENICSRIRKML